MKKLVNLSGIIALVAIIGFLLVGCDFLTGGDDSGNDGGGTGGGSGTTPSITIRNNTGYYIHSWYIKPSNSTDWGSEIWVWQSDGDSKTHSFSQSLSSNNVYDIRLAQNQFGGGHNFRKYGVTISNGMTINFTSSDLNDGNNLPSITIQNRSGVSFNSFKIKPSSSSDWGTSFGSISNNDDRTVTIPIPPSSYTVFDLQMGSSNPTNTYTRTNVAITNGMNFIFTSADKDNPTIEMPVIVIQNNTGYYIHSWYIKPSNSTDWGSEIWVWQSDGTLKTHTLSQSLSTNNVYDIRLAQNQFGGGYNFIKNNVMISEGMILTFTTTDLK
ncbi:MAG: hypothetical protein FWC06_01750 [Treponema sp.]|nr:hypothetical protein [Treponema sp.]